MNANKRTRILRHAALSVRRRRIVAHKGANADRGYLRVICGPMFAGKTTHLVEEAERALDDGLRIQCFRPLRDTRHSEPELLTHNGKKIPAILYEDADALRRSLSVMTDVFLFDEINMAPEEVVIICAELLLIGKRVVAAGLDNDYRANAFPPTQALADIADDVTALTSTCECGSDAHWTLRTADSQELILPGGSDMYKAVCSLCYTAHTGAPP